MMIVVVIAVGNKLMFGHALLVTPLGHYFTEGLDLEMCFFKMFIPPLSESKNWTGDGQWARPGSVK